MKKVTYSNGGYDEYLDGEIVRSVFPDGTINKYKDFEVIKTICSNGRVIKFKDGKIVLDKWEVVIYTLVKE